MKKLVLLVLGSYFGIVVSGCDPCVELEGVCDVCPPVWQPHCYRVVERNNSMQCDGAVDIYERYGCR